MTTTEADLEKIRQNDAAMEELHQLGIEVATRPDPHMEERDWETEALLDHWAGKYVRNIAEHYHEITRGKTIEAFKNALLLPADRLERKTLKREGAVAVVGAGPSLDKNVELLRDFPGLIIACDRAAMALTARNIKPDLVVCVDPRPAVMAEMVNYPENRHQRLALSVLSDPGVARAWRGEIYWFSTQHGGTQLFDRVLPELFPGMPMAFAVGNVGNDGVQLAEWLSARKIVLVGQDYGYTGDRMHCADWVRLPNGSWTRVADDPVYQAEKLAQRTGKIDFEILRDANGKGALEKIQTYPHFITYRNTLYEMVKSWGLDVVNATEGGILTDLPQAALRDVIAELHQQKYSADEAHARFETALGGLP